MPQNDRSFERLDAVIDVMQVCVTDAARGDSYKDLSTRGEGDGDLAQLQPATGM